MGLQSVGNKVRWEQSPLGTKRSVGYTFKRSVGYKKSVPKGLFFFGKLYPMQIDYDYLKGATSEEFVKGEVIVSDSHNATDICQGSYVGNLARAKTRYGDGTFKIASTCPFGQL